MLTRATIQGPSQKVPGTHQGVLGGICPERPRWSDPESQGHCPAQGLGTGPGDSSRILRAPPGAFYFWRRGVRAGPRGGHLTPTSHCGAWERKPRGLGGSHGGGRRGAQAHNESSFGNAVKVLTFPYLHPAGSSPGAFLRTCDQDPQV